MRNLLAVCALLLTGSLHAQQRLLDQPVKIKTMLVDVKADCFTATTFIEMEFYNPGHVEIEGLYRFRLLPGQVVTALQLDLHGKFRDGTIEERWKAANAYNTIVGKRVDPALLQYEAENRYRLNVYPIPARSSRRITMTIQELLKEKNGSLIYELPVAGADSIGKFQLTMSSNNCSSRPIVMPGFLANDAFSFDGNRYTLTRTDKDLRLPFTIGFTLPATEQALAVKRQDGKNYFALRLYPQAGRSEAKKEKLLVYWDVSLSGAKRDTRKEIQFLKEFLQREKIKEVTIVPFTTQVRSSKKFSQPSDGQWEKYLRALTYEGGTSFHQLDLSGNAHDVIMVFSDGKKTAGGQPKTERRSPVYAISSVLAPDSAFLKTLPERSGGWYINLHRLSVQDAIANAAVISSNIFNVLKDPSTQFAVSRSGPSSPVLVYGTFERDDQLMISYGSLHALSTDRFLLRANEDSSSAINRIAMLLRYPQMISSPDASALLDFGLEEKLVTPRTSFIVLERVEDYITYNIAPPKELEEECAARGFVKRSSKELREKEKERIAYQNMAGTLEQYNRLLVNFGVTGIPMAFSFEDYGSYRDKNSSAPVPPVTKLAESRLIETKGQDLEEVVVVTALGVRRQPKELGYSVSKVSAREITQADVVNVQSALTGKVSGLNVSTVNNSVFEDTRITLRGLRSLTGNNQPILVLDGSIVPLHYLNNLNPKDIQDVTILKDASAAALYGPDGVNGVILVTYKKGRDIGYGGKYRLSDMPEETYIQQLAAAPSVMKLAEYEELKELHGSKPLFYIEVAQHLYAAGMKIKAKEVLFNAAEITNADPRVLRSIAFVLEEWKEFSDAISIYEDLPYKTDGVIRDLAWAYYQVGRKQEAVDLIYTYITTKSSDHMANAALLDDMNAMIAASKEISTDKIPKSFLVAKPVDLRLVLSSSVNSVHYMEVEEPERRQKGVAPANTKAYYQYYSVIYQVKHAVKGKYSVSVRHNDWEGNTLPLLVKMIVLKNFGKPNQAIGVETYVMNNQSGLVEIAGMSW